jgi:hypothetical protein
MTCNTGPRDCPEPAEGLKSNGRFCRLRAAGVRLGWSVEQWIKPRRATLSKQRTAAERGSELSRNNLGVVRGYDRLWHNPAMLAIGQPVRLPG